MNDKLFFALMACFLMGLAPLLLTYLNTNATRTKWIWTGIWVAIWWLPPLTQLYRFALSG